MWGGEREREGEGEREVSESHTEGAYFPNNSYHWAPPSCWALWVWTGQMYVFLSPSRRSNLCRLQQVKCLWLGFLIHKWGCRSHSILVRKTCCNPWDDLAQWLKWWTHPVSDCQYWILLFFMNMLQGTDAGALMTTGLSASLLCWMWREYQDNYTWWPRIVTHFWSIPGLELGRISCRSWSEMISSPTLAGHPGQCVGEDCVGSGTQQEPVHAQLAVATGPCAVCSWTWSHTRSFSSCFVPIPGHSDKKGEIRVHQLSHYRYSYKFLPDRKQKQREGSQNTNSLYVSPILSVKFSILR